MNLIFRSQLLGYPIAAMYGIKRLDKVKRVDEITDVGRLG